MQSVLFDTKGNVLVFNNENELEQYLRGHEGIFYLVKKNWKTFEISEIWTRNGKHTKVTERYVDVLD